MVQAESKTVDAPPPVYVQKVTLVCEGIRWEVPYPNYQCCGPSVYNVAKEACNDGLIEARTAAPPTTTTTTQVPTRLLVCQGHRFLIPAYDYQFYACCCKLPFVPNLILNEIEIPTQPMILTFGLGKAVSMVLCLQLGLQQLRLVRHLKKSKFYWFVMEFNTGSLPLIECLTVAVAKTFTTFAMMFAVQLQPIVDQAPITLVHALLVTFVVKITLLY